VGGGAVCCREKREKLATTTKSSGPEKVAGETCLGVCRRRRRDEGGREREKEFGGAQVHLTRAVVRARVAGE